MRATAAHCLPAPRSLHSRTQQHPKPSANKQNPKPLLLVWGCGIVQTVIYCDFFYYYLKSWQSNEKLSLPA